MDRILDTTSRAGGRSRPVRRQLDRRELLWRIGAGSLGTEFAFLSASRTFGQDSQGLLETLGKDARLIVHNARPGVLETPMAQLREHRLTPKQILFVRNNQVLSGALTLDPLPIVGWELELSGLVTPARTISLENLVALEQTAVEAVLQCSGNGRAFYARSARTRGTQWQRGGMGNLRWKGVPLKRLLEALGLKIGAEAQFVAAEGRDAPASPRGADFEQCVPLDDILDTALLATEMNGEPIPVVHGGPLRLIVPGYYGTMNVKWLSRLRFQEQPSRNRHHAVRYRTFINRIEPGTVPAVTAQATVPTWRQKIKSVIWNPVDQAVLAPGLTEVSGVAWNDGRSEIVAVEVSTDGGGNWQAARVEASSSPYGWYRWSRPIELGGGAAEIRVRATDARGRTQLEDGSEHWNPSGYEWYGVDSLQVTVG